MDWCHLIVDGYFKLLALTNKLLAKEDDGSIKLKFNRLVAILTNILTNKFLERRKIKKLQLNGPERF